MTKISVAMIVLNEEDNILRALSSCDFADEVVIVDGGSTDSTLQKINEYEDLHKVAIYSEPWKNDFSIQRNVSFKHCTGDWIIRLDADEIFGIYLRASIKHLLESLPEECLSVRIRQNNLVQDIQHYAANLGGWETHPRIFRNQKDLSWIGQVHEWVPNVNHACTDWNVCVIHFGWLNQSRLEQKEENYMKIPGSGFYEKGSLTNREYVIRKLPEKIY